MQYNFFKVTVALILITVLSTSIFTMEKISAAAEPLSPHKQELIQIKCDLMTAIQTGIHGKDSTDTFSEAHLDNELQEATPRKFKKLARARFHKDFEDRCAAKGITPEMVDSLREQVKEDINLESMADEGHSPASTPIKAQVLKVANRMDHAGLDVRKTYNGNTAYTRGGMLVIDQSVVEEVAPTTPLKEALWAHELTHDKENDLVARLAYERAFEQQGQSISPTSKEYLERFHEIFADIQEASSPQSAKAAHQLAHASATRSTQETACSHPKSTHRVHITQLNQNLVTLHAARGASKRRLMDVFDQENATPK